MISLSRGVHNAAREKWCDPCKNNNHHACLQEAYEKYQVAETLDYELSQLPSGRYPPPDIEVVEFPYGACKRRRDLYGPQYMYCACYSRTDTHV